MTHNQNLKFVTALHGDEFMPVLALASQNIPQIVANVQALALNKRLIDIDMNKSFNTEGDNYEAKRSKEVLKQISSSDLVIDFHSTSAPTDAFAIVTDLAMVGFASTFGLKHIVYMKHNIKAGHALIDHCNGVSVETGIHGTKESFENTLKIINNARLGKTFSHTLYEVDGTITEPGEYKNFELYNNDFYPVLAGEKSYDFYALRAKKIKEA
jgi:hypothetical protein